MDKQTYLGEQKREGVGGSDVDSVSSLSNASVSGLSGRESFDSSEKMGRQVGPSVSYSVKQKFSFEMSEFQSEDEHMRLEDFFDEEVIQERKVDKKDISFRVGFFHPPFAQHLTEILYRFSQKPNELHFSATIDAFLRPGLPIFNECMQQNGCVGAGDCSVLQALQGLIYRNENTFLIYSFDWLLCHLSFVCCLIIFWLQIEMVEPEEAHEKSETPKKPKLARDVYIRDQKRRMKQNVCNVACLYAQCRPQEINASQPIVIVLYHFLGLLRQDDCLNVVQICNTQNRLISDIELFRRIKRKEVEFECTSNQVIFESQMRKYEHENKLTSNLEKTHTLLHLITCHNFVSWPLLKFYQLDGFRNSRKEYQNKMEIIRMWIFEIIIRNCEIKKADSLYKSANYIVSFMAILKRMKEGINLEGFSYLVPVLANIKQLMPNLWKYAVQRRPEVEARMNEYAEFLVKKQVTRAQLSYDKGAILWGDTIFDFTEKMAKKHSLSGEGVFNLHEHRCFYENFLEHLIFFRGRVQAEYEREIEKYNREREIGSSFNMYLLDTYVPKLYKGCQLDERWRELRARAETADKKLCPTLSIELMDYIFVGSTNKYQRIDI